jgi:hypothetical protein
MPGVDDAVARVAEDLLPFSALGLPWTREAVVHRG